MKTFTTAADGHHVVATKSLTMPVTLRHRGSTATTDAVLTFLVVTGMTGGRIILGRPTMQLLPPIASDSSASTYAPPTLESEPTDFKQPAPDASVDSTSTDHHNATHVFTATATPAPIHVWVPPEYQVSRTAKSDLDPGTDSTRHPQAGHSGYAAHLRDGQYHYQHARPPDRPRWY